MTGAGTLTLLAIDGKLYLKETAWPDSVQVTRELINKADPHRTAWDGQNFKLWLENGNAVYTLAPEDDGKGDVLTLHRKVASALTSVPGAALETAPEPPKIIVPDPPRLAAIPLAQWVRPSTAAGLVTTPFTSDLGPMGRALLAAQDPRQAAGKAGGIGGPPFGVPGFFNGVPVQSPEYVMGSGNTSGYMLEETSRYFAHQSQMPGGPITPEEFRRFKAQMQSKLAEMEDSLPLGQNPPSLAVSAAAAAQKWRTFLVDVGAFMQSLGQVTETLVSLGPQDVYERPLTLMDPLALEGQASLAENPDTSGYAMQQRTLSAGVVLKIAGNTAATIRRRASELSRLVSPEPDVEMDAEDTDFGGDGEMGAEDA